MLYFGFTDELVASRYSLGKQSNDININTSMKISIDQDEIFHLKGISINKIRSHPILEAERIDTETFLLPINHAWCVCFDLFKAVFPYEHSFAEAVQNQLISVVKWLKIVHNLKGNSHERPLPADLFINVSIFLNNS